MFDCSTEELADSEGTYAPLATRCSDSAVRSEPSLAAISGLASSARRMTVGRSSSESTCIDEAVSALVEGTTCADKARTASAGAIREKTVNTPALQTRRAARRRTAMSMDIGVGKREGAVRYPTNDKGTLKGSKCWYSA